MTVRNMGWRLLVVIAAVLGLTATACTPTDDDPVETGAETTVAEENAPAPTDVPDTSEPADDPEPADTTEPADEPDDEPEPMDDESEVDEPVLTASWRGVTEDTITVGVSMLDFQALAELGLVTEGWGDQQLVWETYIADLNARGGINGRMIDAHYSFYSPLGSGPAETSCAELTEDLESFAVLGGFLGPAETVNTCVTAVNNTIMINGAQTQERLDQSTAPWVQSGARADRNLTRLLDLLDLEGMLEGRRIAVVGSVELAEVFERAEAELEARGVSPVSIIPNDLPQGDIQGQNEAWTVRAERIRADNADTVLVIGAGQSAFRGIFNEGLDVDVWAVRDTDLNNLGAETTPEMAEGVIAVTGLTEQERWDHPISQECVATFAAANPDVEFSSPDDRAQEEERWFNPIISYCSWLRIFELVMTEAGPELTHDTVAAAIQRLDSFSTAGVPFASFGEGKFDSNDSVRLSVFDMTAGETGALVPLTDIRDITP